MDWRCGTSDELYRNKSSNTKPEHISNFSTMVSEHQPLSQLCQNNCVSGRIMNKWCPQGQVMSAEGNWTLWMSTGRATARRGRELAGTRPSGLWVVVKGDRGLKLDKCLTPAWQQEVTQNGSGGGAGTLHRQKHWWETGPGQTFKPFLQAGWRLIHLTQHGKTARDPFCSSELRRKHFLRCYKTNAVKT